MKFDKEKLLSNVSKITNETKRVTKDISEKTKEVAVSVKDKVSEKIENKELISQEDMLKILDGIYGNVLNGIGKNSPSVEEFSEDYLKQDSDPKVAAKKMFKNQILKCTTSGFISGFGGLIVLPITIPANVSSVLYVQMRMIASCAYMAGYDLKSDQVQSFVYACLAGVSVAEVVKQTGVKIGVKLATGAIKKIPGKALTKINKAVGTRFITKFGTKGVINLGKMVPGVGAVIGGGLDFSETKIIADRAYKWFFEGELEYETVDVS